MEFLIIFGACVIVLGLVYIVTTILTQRSFQGAGNWPKTTGEVLRAFVYRHERRTTGGFVTYTPVVEYAYTVDGERYTSLRRDFAPTSAFEDEREAQKVVADAPVGHEVKVRYNPHFPQQAVLKAPKPVGDRTVLIYGAVGVVMGALMIVLAVLLM